MAGLGCVSGGRFDKGSEEGAGRTLTLNRRERGNSDGAGCRGQELEQRKGSRQLRRGVSQ